MYLLFHSNIIIIKGNSRSMLMDLLNQESLLIPNSLANFITNNNGKSRASIFNAYPKSEENIIKEYLEWLSEQGFIEWVADKKTLRYFPNLTTEWDTPFVFTNIIIDVAEKEHQWKLMINQINFLSIPVLQIRIFKAIKLDRLYSILEHTEKTSLKGIEIILPYTKELEENNLAELLNKFIRIYSIIIYSAPDNNTELEFCKAYPVTVIYTKNDISPARHCGIINEHQFSSNMELYTEGLKNNTCLNRKISIDQNGEIKNCPSMAKSYGNIKDTTLEEAINKKGFKDLWHITKDQVAICKDCEFRHICTDCRAYLQDPTDIHSKPLKCGYDPYTNKWEEWSTNPLSKKGIEHYGMQDLVKKEHA
jgi:SPASM domain peptide maturase of grasp-with-spasm system